MGGTSSILKAISISEGDFYEPFLPNAETVEDFGMTLLTLSFEKELEYNEIIKPFLENWDTNFFLKFIYLGTGLALCQLKISNVHCY